MSVKKLSHNDLKKPDSFVSFFTSSLEWLKGNISVVAIAVAFVLLSTVGAIAFVQHSKSEKEVAFYKYGLAADEFHKALAKTGEERQKGVTAALANLQAVYDANRDSEVASYALLSIGQASFEIRNYEQATNAFKTAAGEFKDNPNFRAMALVGEGKAFEAMRKYDRALDAYQRANAIDGNPYSEVLKSDIGRLKVFRERSGQAEAAQEAAQAAEKSAEPAPAPVNP